MTPSTNMSRAM